MSNGTLGSKDLSFNVIVQNIRRQHMMAAILKEDENGKIIDDKMREQGKRILNNVKVGVQAKGLEKTEKEEGDYDEND